MLELCDVSKSYDGRQWAVADIDLTVAGGEIVCLLGPSGCGKSTLLRLIAGLETPDHGRILLDGEDLTQIPVHRRNFGLMFQEFALFPHRTVGENIAFGLRMANQSRAAIAARVKEMLTLIGLPAYADRSIFALSGGERQRVALARSLAPDPRLLMLDEPLGSLDRALRETLMVDLRAILKRVEVTALYVTHDQQEAFAVADRLVLLNQGRIEQVGAPQALYEHPATPFVARFLGFHNLLPATRSAARPNVVETPIGAFELADGAPAGAPAARLNQLLIRPEAASTLVPGPLPAWAVNGLEGILQSVSFRGSSFRVELAVTGKANATDAVPPLVFVLPNTPSIAGQLPHAGATVHVLLDPALLTLL